MLVSVPSPLFKGDYLAFVFGTSGLPPLLFFEEKEVSRLGMTFLFFLKWLSNVHVVSEPGLVHSPPPPRTECAYEFSPFKRS